MNKLVRMTLITAALGLSGFMAAYASDETENFRYVCRFESFKHKEPLICFASGHFCVESTRSSECKTRSMHVVCNSDFAVVSEGPAVIPDGVSLVIKGTDGDHTSAIEVPDFPNRTAVAEAKLKNASEDPIELDGLCEFQELYTRTLQ